MRDHAMPTVRRIGLTEAKRLHNNGGALLVDVRDPALFSEAYIPGALSLPLREIPRRYAELPRDLALVFY